MPVLADVENQWDHFSAAQSCSAALEVDWMPAEWFQSGKNKSEKGVTDCPLWVGSGPTQAQSGH
jgi:hypothetical protein